MEYFKQIFEAIQKLFIWWVVINPWELGVRIVTFAEVRTYRLIQDGHWMPDQDHEKQK